MSENLPSFCLGLKVLTRLHQAATEYVYMRSCVYAYVYAHVGICMRMDACIYVRISMCICVFDTCSASGV